MILRFVVERIIVGQDCPRVEYLHRVDALFADLDWQWEPRRAGAHVFFAGDDLEQKALWTFAKEHGGHPVTLARDDRPDRPVSACGDVIPLPAAVTPQEAFEALDRRCLA